uniref:GH16 domain-containing protein n=1 Tax=Psilocybe cubensis TaxID=181762 RepID=A0A8H7XP48_PSICU
MMAKFAFKKDSMSTKFYLGPSPKAWGMPVDMQASEPDDVLHNPDPVRDLKVDRGGRILTARGLENLGCLFILCAGMLTLFLQGKDLNARIGYPIIMHFKGTIQTTQGGFNLGGTNASGQVPIMSGNYQLIDRDTPKDAYTRKSFDSGEEWALVFSDEFNTDGRTFYPGDDPWWEAVDLHYWGTVSILTTQNGALRIKIDRVDPINNHNLTYRSGMLQSWNKFCFTGGLIETAVTLPGSNSVSGLWPAVWTMGNLGRAGYGASLDGMWPYSYDSCDVGTLPNQTYPGTRTPAAAVQNGDPTQNGVLSFLPGQRLSACTCPGESHPGPMRTDGSYVGRSAPEIDILEATVDAEGGKVSLSAQWAPYNAAYNWKNTSDNLQIYDPTKTVLNSYKGGVYQQTTSGLALANQDCYELQTQCFSVYGFEYKPGFDHSYITWINDGKPAWTLRAAGMSADAQTEINARPVPQEPMYIIANLGFSTNFAHLDLDLLAFPATMSIDYVRVYQPKDSLNIGCDPPDFPTAQYISTYTDVYANWNLSTWSSAGQPWPKNRQMKGGSC